MIERSMERFDIYPARLVGDSAYGSADMLGWLVYEHGIEPACDGVRQVSAPGWYLLTRRLPISRAFVWQLLLLAAAVRPYAAMQCRLGVPCQVLDGQAVRFILMPRQKQTCRAIACQIGTLFLSLMTTRGC